MTTVQTVRIEHPPGFLAAVVHLPRKLPCAAVVCCHGLMSRKDSAKHVAVGEEMSRAGLAVVRFDFSGCGQSSVEPEGTLVGSRLGDLGRVLDYVSKQTWCDGRIALLGSSFGGYLALLEADGGGERIRAAACWATPFDIVRLGPPAEMLPEAAGLSRKGFRLGEPDNLGGIGPVRNVLLIQGQEDEVAGWGEAVELYRRLGDPKKLLLMRSAEHLLLDPGWRALAIRASLEWFFEHGLG